MGNTDQEHSVMESGQDDDRRASDEPESTEETSTSDSQSTEPEGSGARAAPHESGPGFLVNSNVQMPLSAAGSTGPDGPMAARESVTVT